MVELSRNGSAKDGKQSGRKWSSERYDAYLTPSRLIDPNLAMGTISTEGTIQHLQFALGPTCEKAGVGIRLWDDGLEVRPRGRRRPPIPAVADGQFRGRNSGPLTDRAAHLTTTTFGSTGDGQLGNAMPQRDERVHRLKRFECFSTCQRVQVYLGPDNVTECYV